MVDLDLFYVKVKFGYIGFCMGESENYLFFGNCCCIRPYIKVYYVIGKALSGELSCPCDRSCLETIAALGLKVA